MTAASTLVQTIGFKPLMALVLFATVTIFGVQKYREVQQEQ